MVLEAAARGWLTAEQLWDVAGHVTEGGSAVALLESLLDPEQVSLLRGSGAPNTQVHLDSSIPPPDEAPRRGPVEGPTSMRDLGDMPGLSDSERYQSEELLGRGGAGQVVAARDRELSRVVALKTLHVEGVVTEAVVRRFLVEARVTGQLEHPNIVPVYDIGVSPDRMPFYTMRVVQKWSLSRVLAAETRRDEWPLVRMLNAFMQVCRAVAYAHNKGVLHGDIKPDNILLGDFGEVYLADWGLTRVQPRSPVRTGRSVRPSAPPAPSQTSDDDAPAPARSRPGGTPGYVAPEVAYGDWSKIDHRADLFSLGVVLYEIVTGEQPFQGKTPREVLMATVTAAPVPPRERVPGCPLLLEDLCLELLAKYPDGRPDSATDVATRIENFLEGAKEKERRREEALRLCELATIPQDKCRQYERDALELRAEASAKLKDIEAWRPVEDKRPAWEAEDRAEAAQRESARALAEALDLFSKALGYDTECELAHRGLADLYWERAQQAARERREPTRIYYEALVVDHDTGRYADLMNAKARLSLRSNPPGATVRMHRYVPKDRRLILGDAHDLGATPVAAAELEPGSYLAVLSAPGFRDARYSVVLERGGHHDATVNLYTDHDIGDGFVYVPGGSFIMGGDSDAFDSLPRQDVLLGDYAIAEYPVTVRQYCEFLNDLDRVDRDRAKHHAPCNLRDYVGAIVQRGGDGTWIPHDEIIEGEAREMFPPEDGHLWRVPILLVTWFDARAYCRWRSERDGHVFRMPSEAEWEKAARGVDGRSFPWGDRFDATYCLMRESRSYPQQPEPIGTFAVDESPYGVRDMAGGMREWVGDFFGQDGMQDAVEVEPAASSERGESVLRMVRSGGWRMQADWSRCASRGPVMAMLRGTGLTFRVAKSLSKG